MFNIVQGKIGTAKWGENLGYGKKRGAEAQ